MTLLSLLQTNLSTIGAILGAMAVLAQVHRINGEAAIIVRLAHAPPVVVALVHIETRGGRVAAQTVIRDPRRLIRLSDAPVS